MIRAGARAIRDMIALTRGLRDLRILIVSGVAGTLAAGLLNPVLPLFLSSRGFNLQRIGLVFTVGSLLPIFLQPTLGAISDRFGRKGVLIGVSLLTSLLLPLFALFENPWPLAAVLAAKLVIVRSAVPVSAAMLGDLAPANRRGTVFGLLASATNLMFVVALVSSSALVKLLRTERVFYVASALFLISAFVLFSLSAHVGRPGADAAADPADHPSGLRVALTGLLAPLAYVRRDPRIGALFTYELCFVFALDLFPIYLPLYAVKLGAPEAMIGPLIAVSWLVYALVQPFGGRLSDRRGRRKGIITTGLIALAALDALLGLSGFLFGAQALWVMIAVWALMAIPDGLFRPSASALLVDLAPPEERGRFLGAVGSVSSLANVVAPLVYGIIADRVGLGGAFVLSSFLLLGASAAVRLVDEPAAIGASRAHAPAEVQ